MSEGFKQTQTERCVVYCVSDIRVIHMAPSAGSLCFPPTADFHPCSPHGSVRDTIPRGNTMAPWWDVVLGARMACAQQAWLPLAGAVPAAGQPIHLGEMWQWVLCHRRGAAGAQTLLGASLAPLPLFQWLWEARLVPMPGNNAQTQQ